jgi:hypothetical protein
LLPQPDYSINPLLAAQDFFAASVLSTASRASSRRDTCMMATRTMQRPDPQGFEQLRARETDMTMDAASR